ncbi:hypothetical protein [Actinomycetospora termitidis]|uniref:Uncharacterized protein n=1 Tax=Actinomycetospora termitidis TaxID=3053470 RepID=A0ABT7MJG5_9PSEU|nr:hypothetical protein [Actinomycetospora sp. Odt1-22]MDL5160616.1 hypothetical protein [Actinomycetospora sp. Odt1-22]
MAARRESGAPSARAVLEVADGLRWTDPVLGASLAEHARRLAGDDPAVRAAADRSVVRSLAEADRHEDVVERAIPLLTEARDRGDRDDGGAVLVELAAAAVGLGEPALAQRLLDRLDQLDDFPARVAAGAWTVRAEARAAGGDVVMTDEAVEAGGPVLLRVPQPESDVLRARLALARVVARRIAGDTTAALAVLGDASTSGDLDGGRCAVLVAAEEIELLVGSGQADEALHRARAVLPDAPAEPHTTCALARIRLAVARVDGTGGVLSARTAAEELEASGRLTDAARAWETVAAVAEERGELGEALRALRHGHGLGARAREGRDGVVRSLVALADGPEPLPARVDTMSDAPAEVPTRARRGHHRADDETPPPPSPAAEPTEAIGWPAPDPDPSAETLPTGRETDLGTVSVGSPPGLVEPVPAPESPAEPARSARDELAELLASLTRSVDSSLAHGPGWDVAADEPAPAASSTPSSPRTPDAPPPAATTPGETVRRSRHSAPTSGDGVAPPIATSRPTFDAFGTAPLTRLLAPEPGEPAETTARDSGPDRPSPDPVAPDPVAPEPVVPEPLPDERFAPSTAFAEPAVSGPGTDHDDRGDARSLSSLLAAEDGPGRDESSDPPVAVGSDPRNAPAGPEGLPVVHSPESTGDDSFRARLRSETVDAPSDARDALDPGWRREAEERPSTAAPAEDLRPWGTDRSSTPDIGRPTNGTAPGPSSEEHGRTGPGPSDPAPARPVEGATRSGGTTATNAATAHSGEGRDARAEGSRTGPRSEYDDELALTLASVLAEYNLPDVPMPPRRDRGSAGARPAGESRAPANGTDPRRHGPQPPAPGSPGEVAVPSARRHTSGSMPVQGERDRWEPRRNGTPREGDRSLSGGSGTVPGPGGRGRPPESGAKLADLLAEAMDAFRHVGPTGQDDVRPPGVGSRRA